MFYPSKWTECSEPLIWSFLSTQIIIWKVIVCWCLRIIEVCSMICPLQLMVWDGTNPDPNQGLLHCRQSLLQLSYEGSPQNNSSRTLCIRNMYWKYILFPKGEINNNTIIVGDFNTPLTPMDQTVNSLGYLSSFIKD